MPSDRNSSLDPLDRRILAQLQRDSALTNVELGEAVGLSPSAVHRRVARLREDGVVLGYRAVLSRAARGDPATVLVNVTLRDQRQETMAAFEREIAGCPDITTCFLMSGEADYMIHVEVRRDDTFERIHRETLSQLPGVTRLASHFVIREVVRPA